MNHCWLGHEGYHDQGRRSELSRRLSFLVLFSAQGRPGPWLALLAGLWALVAATTLGNAG